MATLIEVIFTDEDVRTIASDMHIPEDIALGRADEWAKAIRDTLIEIGNEQLASVIETGQP